MGRATATMRSEGCHFIFLVPLIVAATTLVSSTSSWVVTSQYKTYGSSMYAGDIPTCTDTTVITTELERGSDIFSGCLASCTAHSDCGSFWLSTSGCVLLNTTKCQDTTFIRPAASNITYHLKIVV